MLRQYQTQLFNQTFDAWNAGHRDVLAVMPTGAGKTTYAAHVIKHFNQPTSIVAHRQELVSQLSCALADVGISHDLVAPKAVAQSIVQTHYKRFGQSFYHFGHPVKVGGVGTYVSRWDKLSKWANTVRLWVQDEAHHTLRENQWGKVRKYYPNAFGLGLTATPGRTDGKGLSRDSDGFFDTMINGPSMRELIDQGYLCDYDFIAPPNDIQVDLLKISQSTGDYTQQSMTKAVLKSHIVGDAVKHYERFAAGKLTVLFADSIESGEAFVRQFNAGGHKANLLTGKTHQSVRTQMLREFENRSFNIIVNVDLFGEGTDIPVMEAIIMARMTKSLSLYIQQFGRPLRTASGKDYGIVIDMVNNWREHGFPDQPRIWNLDRREKSSRKTPSKDALTDCLNCYRPYLARLIACPHCGTEKEIDARAGPIEVDGDLERFTPEFLAEARKEIIRINGDPLSVKQRLLNSGAGSLAAAGAEKNHRVRKQAHVELHAAMSLWGGRQRAIGVTDRESYKLFFLTFGVDILTAQTLSRSDATALKIRVLND